MAGKLIWSFVSHNAGDVPSETLQRTKCAIKTIIGLLFLFVCYGGSSKSGLKERRLTRPRYRRLTKLVPAAELICIRVYCGANLPR